MHIALSRATMCVTVLFIWCNRLDLANEKM
jgi:hypothetical protein